MAEKLPLGAKIALISKMVDDLSFYKEAGSCPEEQHFKIVSSDEDVLVEADARHAALKKMAKPIKKVAFDTRRVNQDVDRNPRRNLQYWHRSEDFVDEETSNKLKVFAKLDKVVKQIQSELGREPEWFDSYARALSSNLDRLEMKTAGDSSVEVFKPHVSYLEQLVYNRYRFTLNDIKNASEKEIRDRIMSKDEDLEKKGEFLMSTGGFDIREKKIGDSSSKDELLQTLAEALANGKSPGQTIVMPPQQPAAPAPEPVQVAAPQPAQVVLQQPERAKDASDGLLSAPLRRAGEKSVERTITIKIVDSVVE